MIEAWRLAPNPEDNKDVLEWSTNKRPIVIVSNQEFGNLAKTQYAEITTLEGVMRADVGDWIIKGVEGEVYPCKDSVFLKTYDAIIE